MSVDTVLGCEVCSVVVIYDPDYNINNFTIVSTESILYHHYHSGDINWILQVFLMRIISMNVSALPHCKVGDKEP